MAADHSRPVTSASSVAPAPQHLLCVHYTCICTRPDATLVPCAQGMLPSVPPSAQGRRLRESLTSSHSILSQSSHASSMVRLWTCVSLGRVRATSNGVCAQHYSATHSHLLLFALSSIYPSLLKSGGIECAHAVYTLTHATRAHAHSREDPVRGENEQRCTGSCWQNKMK